MKTYTHARLGALAAILIFTLMSISWVLGTPASSLGPPRSTPIAITTNNVLVSVNPDTNTISVFDASSTTPTKLAEIVVGREPSSVALSPDGQLAYVANAFDGTISIVDLVQQMQV